MSLFGKLLGRRSAAEERQNADELYARADYGLAKLAYERALGQARGEPEALRTELAKRVDECRDAIARGRIAEGDKLLAAGHPELALIEFHGAADTAASRELVLECERRMEGVERRDAREKATLVEQSADERYETISGSFEEEQYTEYASYGPEFHGALLGLYDGDSKAARPLFERLASEHEQACYLLFELGRARLLEGDTAGGRDALTRFVAKFAEGEGGEARLVAHMELASLHDEAGEFDLAAGEYEAAVYAMPDDPRPYLAMAMFFRRAKLPAEAIDVLDSGLSVLEEGQRQFRFTLERGLCLADLGQDAEAIEALEDVVTQLTQRNQLDLPPECAVVLAALHEKTGQTVRALDLYHLLASGSDVQNHFIYHREAARLLQALGHASDARRMLQRATELAPEDPEVRADLARRLTELSGA